MGKAVLGAHVGASGRGVGASVEGTAIGETDKEKGK